ncbi:AraC family transcriptional regulator [Candidatus Stoquefichus massiliensis]|uniref:AraC family transcriptional regulator n=1 Tax=Candidatus Stoquefichus massiliensis TaxID=1470350 RepID=UPI000482F38B|nr:AraC family transcriptional regulator [Candidatus Stoquefichus massiliensis]
MYSSLEVKNKTFEDLYVKFCGMQECTPGYSYGPAVRQHYLIHYCLSGKGEYHINNKVYHIQAGDAFLIMPQVVTYYQADKDDPWTYAWVGFDGKKAELYLEHCHLHHNNLVVQCGYIDEIREIMISMLAHYKLSYSNEMFIQGEFFRLLSYLMKSANLTYKEENHQSDNSYVQKSLEYIQNNYQNVITVQEIADYLSINRSYLTTLFKQFLHLSPQEFIKRYRMNQAEELLVNSDLTINQISFSCGYANQLSFSKAFRQYHDISPKEYRKQYQLDKEGTRTEDPHKI